MRGEDQTQHELFGYGSLEERVPQDHQLRPIRAMVDEALKVLDGRFDELYDKDGRKSIPPERLLRVLLQMLYSPAVQQVVLHLLHQHPLAAAARQISWSSFPACRAGLHDGEAPRSPPGLNRRGPSSACDTTGYQPVAARSDRGVAMGRDCRSPFFDRSIHLGRNLPAVPMDRFRDVGFIEHIDCDRLPSLRRRMDLEQSRCIRRF